MTQGVVLDERRRKRFRFRIPRLALHLRRDVPLAILDIAVIVPCYLVPLVLRFDGSVPRHWWGNFLSFMPLVAVLHLLSNYLLGLYGQMWRYASVE
ncbi:MAG: hypothetical protein ACRDGW_01435, partial [Actinomycetota bacterium]